MQRTSRQQVNVSLEQVRAHAEQSFASILLDIQAVDARLSRAAFGAQVGNEKYFLHIDQIFIRANGNGLSVEAFQCRVFIENTSSPCRTIKKLLKRSWFVAKTPRTTAALR